jgi:hypothetical protein
MPDDDFWWLRRRRRSAGGVTPSFAVVDDDLGLVIEATFSVTATDLVVDVTAPPAYVGTYLASLASLALGPVNIIAPVVTGSIGTGNVATASAGIWVYDLDQGTPTITRQWEREDGTDIAGETATTYTQQANDGVLGVSIRETATNTEGTGEVVTVFRAAPAFPNVIRFDGTDHIRPSANQVNTSSQFAIACRFRAKTINLRQHILGSGDIGVYLADNNRLAFYFRHGGSNPSGFGFPGEINTTTYAVDEWVSLLFAVDGAAGLTGGRSVDCWVNGARRKSLTGTLTGDFNAFTSTQSWIMAHNSENRYANFDLSHWFWLSKVAIDPETHWSSFFNGDNTVKDLGDTGVVGGVTPLQYLRGTDFLTANNRGTGIALSLFGTPEIIP